MKVHRAFEKDRPKTDAIDSTMIAEYAWRYRDKLTLWTPHEAVVEQIKVLLTTREQIVKQQTAFSNSRKALKRKYIQTPVANGSLDALLEQTRLQIKELEAGDQTPYQSAPNTCFNCRHAHNSTRCRHAACRSFASYHGRFYKRT